MNGYENEGKERAYLEEETALRIQIAFEVLQPAHLHHIVTGLRYDFHHGECLLQHVRFIASSLGVLQYVREHKLVFGDSLDGFDEEVTQCHFVAEL